MRFAVYWKVMWPHWFYLRESSASSRELLWPRLIRLNWILYLVSWSLFSSTILIMNQPCIVVSPTINQDMTLLIMLVNRFGHFKFTMLQLSSLTRWFFIHISIIHENIPMKNCEDAKYLIPNLVWVIDMHFIRIPIIHDNTCKLIHKLSCERSYHVVASMVWRSP